MCSDGTTAGFSDPNGVVCCSSGCNQCSGPGCSTSSLPNFGGSDCCGGSIQEAGVYCGDFGTAPCIIGSDPGGKKIKLRTGNI